MAQHTHVLQQQDKSTRKEILESKSTQRGNEKDLCFAFDSTKMNEGERDTNKCYLHLFTR